MASSKPEWYNRLQTGPFKKPTFTQHTIQRIEARISSEGSRKRLSRRSRGMRMLGGIAGAALCLALLLWLVPGGRPADTIPGNPVFHAAKIHVGDKVGGMKVISKEEGTYGVDSVKITFEGKLELSGQFEYYYGDMEPYNPNDVIFIPDEASVMRLPRPESMQDIRVRLALDFTDPQEKASFGTQGSTGTATIIIDSYSVVAAEILEGVPNRAHLAGISEISLAPRVDPETANPDFDKAMADFPPAPLNAKGELDTEGMQPWLEQVDQQFAEGLVMNEKPISANQRGRVHEWLNQVFTEEKTIELLDTYVPEIGGGEYMIFGGLSNLFPPVIIEKFENPSLERQGENSYRYSVMLIVTGTENYKLFCSVTLENGVWKIGDYYYEPS
ncbi:Uncharacterised protein [Chlamydia abortus]|nr:Uncharacterised protein [Chlamydia abortus]